MKHVEREKRKARLVRLWEQHYPDISVESAARVVGFSSRTVYRYLKEAGQPLPPRKPRRVIDMEKVKRAHALYAQYGQKTKVARVMGMHRSQIEKYLKMDIPD